MLLTTDDIGEFLALLDDWICEFGFEKDNYDISDIGRSAERTYDYVYYNN